MLNSTLGNHVRARAIAARLVLTFCTLWDPLTPLHPSASNPPVRVLPRAAQNCGNGDRVGKLNSLAGWESIAGHSPEDFI